MPKIQNWTGIENSCMKGYILYALKLMGDECPNLKLSDEQKDMLFNALSWATDDKTAQEAYDYYCTH